MNSMFKAAVICLGTLATVSAAEAMPGSAPLANAPATLSVGGVQVEKALVVVRRRVVRRPAIIVRRPMRRVVRIRRF